MLPKIKGPLLSLAACVLALVATCSSVAETFTITPLSSDQGWNLIGVESTGAVVVLSSYSGDYETFLNGTLVSQSPTAPPPSAFDDGSACTPTMPSGFVTTAARCNGSFQAIDGFDFADNPDQHTPRLYSGSDLAADFVTNGGGGLLFLNSAGTLAWDDAYSDTIYEATPKAIAPTPEPSTLALLTIGTLTLAATSRRRSCA